MKLNSVKDKISYLMGESIYSKCYIKTYHSILYDIWIKIDNKIFTPNRDSIEDIQRRIINNLENEIN